MKPYIYSSVLFLITIALGFYYVRALDEQHQDDIAELQTVVLGIKAMQQ